MFRKTARHALVMSCLAAFPLISAVAHCELPCGIYGDEMRFDMIDEHLETIAKSMRQIEELGTADQKNYNQIVRWVVNKEEHAEQLREILTVYFLDQRIKPAAADNAEAQKKYLRQLEVIHRMMIHVMKSTQTTDLAHVETLRELKKELYTLYFGKEHEKHRH